MNNTKNIKVSIITIVFNGKEHIEKTIQSVTNQTYKNIEYIIIDGGSTDGTVDIIKKYEDKINYWISEKDKGISDAFNKGIAVASGELIGLINADDWYELNALEIVVDNYKNNGEGIYCGNLKYWKGNESIYVVESNPQKIALEMTINHPTTFVCKSIYDDIGTFNLNRKYAMDYDFLLRAFAGGYKFYNIKVLLANMSFEGVSDINWDLALKEVKDSKLDNEISPINAYAYYYYQIIRRHTRNFLIFINLDSLIVIYRKNFSINKKF